MTLEKYISNKKRKLFNFDVIIYDELTNEKVWHDRIIVFKKNKEYYGFTTKQERILNDQLLKNYGKRNIDYEEDQDCNQIFIYLL